MSLALPPATKYTWRQAPWIPKGERINSNSPTHPCSYNLMHHISHCRDQTAAFLEGQTDQDSSEATCNWQHFYSVLTSKDASRNLFPLGTEIQTKICLIQRLGKNKQTFGRALPLKTAHMLIKQLWYSCLASDTVFINIHHLSHASLWLLVDTKWSWNRLYKPMICGLYWFADNDEINIFNCTNTHRVVSKLTWTPEVQSLFSELSYISSEIWKPAEQKRTKQKPPRSLKI